MTNKQEISRKIGNLEEKVKPEELWVTMWNPSSDEDTEHPHGYFEKRNILGNEPPIRITPQMFLESLLAETPQNEWPIWLKGLEDVLTGSVPRHPFRTLDHPNNVLECFSEKEKAELLALTRVWLKAVVEIAKPGGPDIQLPPALQRRIREIRDLVEAEEKSNPQRGGGAASPSTPASKTGNDLKITSRKEAE
jgi:hypothetical protein